MSELRVRDLMREDFPRAMPNDSVARARDMMYEERVRHLPVVEGARLVGLVSHRDLLRDPGIERYERPVWIEDDRLAAIPVARVMKRTLETVGPDDSAAEAGAVMLREKFGCLPVVEEGRLIGLLTEADFVRHVVELAAAKVAATAG